MFKKLIVASLLMLGVIAIYRVDVDAHLAGYIYDGTWRHVDPPPPEEAGLQALQAVQAIRHYDCVGNFRQVPNPASHPAVFECEGFISQLLFDCANPQGQVTNGNNIRTDISIIGGVSFNQLEVKQNGTATATVGMPSLQEYITLLCQAKNKQWVGNRELIVKVDVLLKTFDLVCANKGQCATPTIRVPAYQAWVHCDLPPGLDLVSNPPPQGTTSYVCFVVREVHCDRELGCPIDIDTSRFALREQPFNLNAGIHSLWNRVRKALT